MRSGIGSRALPAAAVVAAGCGSGGSSGDADGTASIAGLWDFSHVDPDFGEDVFYRRIDADGTLTDIDFQDDEFDGGGNCYLVEQDGVLVSTGGNRYEFRDEFGNVATDDFGNAFEAVTIVRRGDSLVITSVGSDDEDGDGDVTDTITSTAELLTGVDPVFTPCA